MSAEILRRAASLMRERAERLITDDEASAEGWHAHLGGVGTAWINNREGHLISAHGMPRHAEHIASWHPAVALAVADWLETVALMVATFTHGGRYAFDGGPESSTNRALAVARAYLGESDA